MAFTTSALQATKRQLRKLIRIRLESLSEKEIEDQGNWVQQKVLDSSIYKKSKYVGLYINFTREIPTIRILKDILQPNSGKICFVPRIIEQENSLKLLRVYTMEDLLSFSKNKWNIHEPTLEYEGLPREEAIDSGKLDLLIVPGLAFDESGGRLGRGKGYP